MLEHTPHPGSSEKMGHLKTPGVEVVRRKSRIPGTKLGRIWLIPQSTEKPFDQRLKGRKEDARENISCR